MTRLSPRELRILQLKGIIRDVGTGFASGPVTREDASHAAEALRALDRGEEPAETEREKIDQMLHIDRSE